MRRLAVVVALALVGAAVLVATTSGRDRPYSTSDLIAMKLLPAPEQYDVLGGQTGGGGQFSKTQITRFRCSSSGNPSAAVDLSCNDTAYGQDWAPDNEIAIAVDPADSDHLVAGSNDYYYRFNTSTGARQAIVPTGFFTSFDGGTTWVDGQIPLRSGNGAGDPAPAFDAKHGAVLMAQLENVGGMGGGWVSQGDVSVSRSTDGGLTWSSPVTVMKGTGTGIGPANQATFFDKEWITVDNNPLSPYYGRAYLTASRFLNGPQGSYAESPIYLSTSDDGGKTWATPIEISGSHASCTYQETGAPGECDEDQFSIPEVAPNGDVYVHFLNEQNEAAWEVDFDFDNQIMVVKSTDGGVTWGAPVPVVQVEDGFSDMPFSVIGRQTVWGHQIRWAAAGNISISPVDQGAAGADIAIVFADRGTPNPSATEGCFSSLPGTAPGYDPCAAGPGSDTNVYVVTSSDGGATWSGRTQIDAAGGVGKHEWFPWADHKSDGTLAVAWDRDTAAAPADAFEHVLSVGGGAATALGGPEYVDVSITHWAGQYTTDWPGVCGPAGYEDPSGTPAEGKDCNVFHGDYTGLAVGPDDSINVVWTGLNRSATSPQIDFYTGLPHDGYVQDAMFARR